MSDAKKTHKLTLGKHSEHVSEQELESIKAKLGRRFDQYEVEPLQPAKPADEAPKKEAAAKSSKDASTAA